MIDGWQIDRIDMSDYFDLWMDEGWIVILDRSMDIIILQYFIID